MGIPATYESLAEEATELAHAAQKMARLLRKENPVSKDLTEEGIHDNLIEEYSDVCLMAQDLGLNPNKDIAKAKTERFFERVTHKDDTPQEEPKEDEVEHVTGEVEG